MFFISGIPGYGCTTVILTVTYWDTFWCFQFFAIANKGVVDNYVQVSVWTQVFISLEWKSRSQVTRSWGKYMFSFKKMPNVFQSGCIISLASYSNVWKVFYLHSQYHSVMSLFCFSLYFRCYNRYVEISHCPNFFDGK